jgi:Williams-Beuren syndrome DDT (WSD), D-TOX E motif/DDT domain
MHSLHSRHQLDDIAAAQQERTSELQRLQKEVEKARTAARRTQAAQEKAIAKLEGGGTAASRYPIDDALLSTEAARSSIQPRPALVKALPVPPQVQGTVLRCWDFLHAFSGVLGLATFCLDAFVSALQHNRGPTLLLAEAHCTLLQLLLRESAGQKMWAEAVMQRKGKTGATTATTAGVDADSGSSSSAIAVLAAATVAQTAEEELALVPAGARLSGATAAVLATPLTWQTVTRLLAPKLPPWTRTAAAAALEQADAAAGAFKQPKAVTAATAAAPEGSARAQMAAWTAAIAALGTSEHWALSQEHKVALLDLLVEAAYSTKKVATVLQANMTDRLQLEAQRREETGRMSREAKEELAIKKERITTELKEAAAKAFEAETAAAATPAAATATAAKSKGKGKAAAVTADKAGSSAKEGGKELAEPKAVSYHEVHRHLEVLLDQEAVGIGPFKVRDIIAEDAATDAATTAAGDSSSGAAAAAGDSPSSDVEDSELYLATLTRTEMMARRREKEAKRGAKAAAAEKRKADIAGRAARASALTTLNAALKREDVKALSNAIKTARSAGLEGGKDSSRWAAPQLVQACRALVALRDKLRRAEVASRYKTQLATKFVRTEPLGCDRDWRRYWVLEGDHRVFVEEVTRRSDAPPAKGDLSAALAAGGALPPGCSAVARAAAAARAVTSDEAMAAAAELQLQLYDAADTHPLQQQCRLHYLETEEEIRDLILSLDERGVREKALKEALQERFDMAELERCVAANAEEHFEWRTEGSEHLGTAVRRKFSWAPGGYTTGRVTGWISADENEGQALWHVVHLDGDEEDLEEDELLAAQALATAAAAAAEQELAEAAAGRKGASSANGDTPEEELPPVHSPCANYHNTMTAKSQRATVADLGTAALRSELLLRESLIHRLAMYTY